MATTTYLKKKFGIFNSINSKSEEHQTQDIVSTRDKLFVQDVFVYLEILMVMINR